MGLLDSLFGSGTKGLNKSAAEAEARLAAGKAEAEAALKQGRADLTAGYDQAQQYYDQAAPGLRSDLITGYDNADAAIRAGYGGAESAISGAATTANARLDPFVESGRGAQGLYDTALGVNGADAATQFYQDYGGNDPFRAYRDEMAQRELERKYNAGGSFVGGGAGGGGSGRFATATARASLERGTQDLQTYLDRLERAGARGAQYAGQQGSNDMTAGSQVASLRAGQGNAIAANETSKGSALSSLGERITGQSANLAVGKGQALAGNSSGLSDLAYGYGQQRAANEINLGNALTAARARPAQNLISLAGLGVQAFKPSPLLALSGSK